MPESDIPLIDISPLFKGPHRTTEEAIEYACIHSGFFQITGHGIASELLHSVRSVVQEYFAQEIDEKLRDKITRDNYRGYIPESFFSTNNAVGEVDQYEGYKLHQEVPTTEIISHQCNLYGPNKWPLNIPRMQPLISKYWEHCDCITTLLLSAFARILRIDASEFLSFFEWPLTNMTLLHYPPRQKPAIGIHPHKDTDALTLLVPDNCGGLYIKPRNSQTWLLAEVRENALLANIGDMLEIWSGGRFQSTPHKVISQPHTARFSFPYFSVPRHDVVVQPLVEPLPEFTRRSASAGEISRAIWQSNWADAAPVSEDLDPQKGW